MLDANSSSRKLLELSAAGTRLIAIGLAVLIAAAWIPALPVLTAVSVLTLGATTAMLARFRSSPLLVAATMLHAATYATLYALFVGATFQLGASSTSPQFGLLNALDLFTSWLILVVAAREIATALRRA